ncbi:hypothetical protein Pla22_13030 [Rubripirellula amarantea]|uniref:Glycoside hydrolase family 42 N-terminal domain-containing protein n=1 Tax=Rubripirellula amarantea TaxID=2527999 RepID=A0A5C5WV25_9BACT|nr:hypothetical protein [Rubripirellula amarantea]TWT53672.1 hypothetical protein Pla22_13030 [Rubripirellula amarantea]
MRLSFVCSLACLALVIANFSQVNADDFIWVEGEDAVTHSMKQHGWYNSVKRGELSGGQWLSHFGTGELPVAKFDVQAKTSGEHELWLRANPIAAAMSVRINGGDWTKVSFAKNEQQLNIASDGKPDLRFVAWVKAQPVVLDAGINSVEFRFESDNNLHGGLDCFVLSAEPFLPQGNRKPGQKTGHADQGTWAFEPDRDRFTPDSLLDLSELNEKPAGKRGRIARSSDGADFVDGSGKPIRFWAVNTGVQYRDDMDTLDEHARWLAKRGVNMVRHHGHLAPDRDSQLTDVNQKDIDAAWRLVAAMKKQGIYVTLSPYWAVSVKNNPSWGLKDAGGDNLTGLIFFDKKLQDAYKGWLRELLTRTNPHTGMPLAEDPTVAIFQIQNEDSLLFWTEQAIQGEQRIELGRHFGKWLQKKYGSLSKATQAWGGQATNKGDDFGSGLVMPHTIYHLTQDQEAPLANRLNDQLEFYVRLMYEFNSEIARFLKDDLGYPGLVNAGNWRTADAAKLFDAERFAYSANDVIGVNRYYNGGSHVNPNDKSRSGYLVSQGDVFSGQSALKQPWAFPLTLRQVAGHPMIISESAWVPPLRYQSEGPFLVAAYGALTGFDIFYWFATDDIGFGPPMGKWQLSTPAQIGMFPAAALMFRRGDIQQGTPALVERRSPQDVWSRKSPLLPEESGFDPNRDSQAPATKAAAAMNGTVTPLAYLTGPVQVDFKDGKTEVADLRPLISSDTKTVQSNTGQLKWHYGNGVCTLNSPNAQGATGDLASAGLIELDTITMTSNNEYASVLVVSMDDQPLTTSSKVLLQIGTTARPYGWKTESLDDDKLRITNLGSSPWNMENTQLKITIANSSLQTATLLDANGVAVEKINVSTSPGLMKVVLPKQAMYVVLR